MPILVGRWCVTSRIRTYVLEQSSGAAVIILNYINYRYKAIKTLPSPLQGTRLNIIIRLKLATPSSSIWESIKPIVSLEKECARGKKSCENHVNNIITHFSHFHLPVN